MEENESKPHIIIDNGVVQSKLVLVLKKDQKLYFQQ